MVSGRHDDNVSIFNSHRLVDGTVIRVYALIINQPVQGVYFMDKRIDDSHICCIVVAYNRVAVRTVDHEGLADNPIVDRFFQLYVTAVIAAHKADLNETFARFDFFIDDPVEIILTSYCTRQIILINDMKLIIQLPVESFTFFIRMMAC